jgi:hypothetical protein
MLYVKAISPDVFFYFRDLTYFERDNAAFKEMADLGPYIGIKCFQAAHF